MFRRLGRLAIPAKVWDCTDDWAALAEIDDNLAHAELDTLELAVFLARRKEVYERAHPETKRGSAGGRAKNQVLTDDMSVSTFVASSAEKMGTSERNVRRLVAAGLSIDPKEITQLRNAPRKVTLADLQIIAKVGNPVDRYDICRGLGDGTAKTAKEVMNRKKAPGAAKKDKVEVDCQKMSDAFIDIAKDPRFAGAYVGNRPDRKPENYGNRPSRRPHNAMNCYARPLKSVFNHDLKRGGLR